LWFGVRIPAWSLRVAALRYRFQESLFLFPALVAAGGIGLAVLATAIDETTRRTTAGGSELRGLQTIASSSCGGHGLRVVSRCHAGLRCAMLVA
jgi:hypothetical protein